MLSQTNPELPIQFDLTFKGLDVQQDEIPNILIEHTISTKKVKQDDLFIKINGIEYDIEINEILRSNSNENLVINLGKTYSYFISFFPSKIPEKRSVLIKIPINKFPKLVNSKLINGKFLFKICCVIDYETYFRDDVCYYLKDVRKSPPIFLHDSKYEYRTEPSDEQISLIIEKNKYISKLGIELALLDHSFNNQPLNDAIENLKLAAQGFIEGNHYSIIINTRNAIANNLTELENFSSSKKRRILKKDIKEKCLSNVPSKDKDDYKEILNYIGKVATSLLSIIHKYAHENQSTIRMKPLYADLEFLYYSTSVIAKYLTTLNNTKL